MHWLFRFKDLVYPPLCVSCGLLRPLDNHIFCLECLQQLPETGYHKQPQNPFTMHFDGRVPITTGSAFLFFSRGGGTQRILHHIKYYSQPELITALGRWYAKQLMQMEWWSGIEAIVPVPLHWKKQRKRGYNQSAVFAEALADVFDVPAYSNVMLRVTHDKSLTGMKRLERIETIGSSFVVAKPAQVRNKHVLLVDDVLTTGATLESCALQLWKQQVASVRMVTLACGEL
jgi:ComF family protein